jgi:hypothetical protein
MSVNDFGVTSDDVLKYLAQWQNNGAALNDLDDINTGGEFLVWASATVQEALAEGGCPTTITSADDEVAFVLLKSLVAEITALRYSDTRHHLFTGQDETLKGAWGRVRDRLRRLRDGEPLGGLRVVNPQTGQQTYSTNASNNRAVRFRFSDSL